MAEIEVINCILEAENRVKLWFEPSGYVSVLGVVIEKVHRGESLDSAVLSIFHAKKLIDSVSVQLT